MYLLFLNMIDKWKSQVMEFKVGLSLNICIYFITNKLYEESEQFG
jgi:hypothetical protein